MAALNSVPTWMRPHRVLSGGEKARAELALRLQRSGVLLDDFADGLQPQPAVQLACAARRVVTERRLSRVLCSCRDVFLARSLLPDVLILLRSDGGPPRVLSNPNPLSLRRPSISIAVAAASPDTAAPATAVPPLSPACRSALRPSSVVVHPPLGAGGVTLTAAVALDAATALACEMFDLPHAGVSVTTLPPCMPAEVILSASSWSVGLILGASGSGKTSQLRALAAAAARRGGCSSCVCSPGDDDGDAAAAMWSCSASVASQLVDSSAAPLHAPLAVALVAAVGLHASVAARPFHTLSSGERARSHCEEPLARRRRSGGGHGGGGGGGSDAARARMARGLWRAGG